MDGVKPTDLQGVQRPPEAEEVVREARSLGAFGLNPHAELVADVIAATGLLPPDRLDQVRGRALHSRSTFSQALVDEGLASEEGLARLLSTRHGVPYVELAVVDVEAAATREVPLHVLTRSTRAAVRAFAADYTR